MHKTGSAKRITPDAQRALNLKNASRNAIETVKLLPLNTTTTQTILRELYEALRQTCESIGYIKGYTFRSHDVITQFLKEIVGSETSAMCFDRYRKMRHRINYLGQSISVETVNEAMDEIQYLIKQLNDFTKPL